jgi:site-specific DNA-methyltransferase (adenine-specific)
VNAPYYQDEQVTLFYGDCREVTEWLTADVLVSDPPYPNNAGHFDDAVHIATKVLQAWHRPAVVFWSEIDHPLVPQPLVAVHIWHRTNVNGRPYEAAYQFDPTGIKRRSLVIRHAAINEGATGSAFSASPVCSYGHPTQKPVGVMERLIEGCPPGVVADPFAGTGTTLVAARNLGRKAIGVELEEKFCEVIARRFRGLLDIRPG